MITLKTLAWSDWFSYGKDNIIEFTDGKVTQITGINGSGKSSIPVILGEVLYGKNAFGKVKQQLFNRYIDSPIIKATITFDKDNIEYIIKYTRKSVLKLVLFENGIDISSHSSTNTLKTINEILGFDFKLFWQLIYQSSTIGLEFLTATDTNRKKFLINLFNLDKYITIHEQFKRINNEINNELLTIKGKLSTTQSWIEKNEKEDLTEKLVEEIPSIDKDDIDKLADLKIQLANINETNKKINNNNQYKSILKNLDTSILSEVINIPDIVEANNKLKELQKLQTQNNAHKKIYQSNIKSIEILSDTCPTCTQNISSMVKAEYINDNKNKITIIDAENNEYRKETSKLHSILAEYQNSYKKLEQKNLVEKELQDLLLKINDNLPSEIINKPELQNTIKEQTNLINSINSSIKIITSRNLIAEAHNSRIKVIKEQLKEYKEQLNELSNSVTEKQFVTEKLNVIKKAFSTNGLVNYKIEYLVKDLEHQINSYLEELSNGRFQLLFALNGEKLDIDIIDDGKTIGIEELSAGELARINTSTLLAIRKLMAAISSTKLNVLFLDEIMGVLDDEGKEKLIDILNSETELNTFLVSHEFEHPLIPKINIIKENKISRIENG